MRWGEKVDENPAAEIALEQAKRADNIVKREQTQPTDVPSGRLLSEEGPLAELTDAQLDKVALIRTALIEKDGRCELQRAQQNIKNFKKELEAKTKALEVLTTSLTNKQFEAHLVRLNHDLSLMDSHFKADIYIVQDLTKRQTSVSLRLVPKRSNRGSVSPVSLYDDVLAFVRVQNEAADALLELQCKIAEEESFAVAVKQRLSDMEPVKRAAEADVAIQQLQRTEAGRQFLATLTDPKAVSAAKFLPTRSV